MSTGMYLPVTCRAHPYVPYSEEMACFQPFNAIFGHFLMAFCLDNENQICPQQYSPYYPKILG